MKNLPFRSALFALSIVLMPILTASAANQPNAAAAIVRQGPLAADTLQSVRNVGRGVIIAKGSAVSEPELVALQQEMQGLSADLAQAMRNVLNTPPVAQKTSASDRQNPAPTFNLIQMPTNNIKVVLGADGKMVTQEIPAPPTNTVSQAASFIPQSDIQQVTVSASDPYAKVRQRLTQVQTRLQQYNDAAKTRGGEARTIQAQTVSTKVTALHDELLNALDDSSPNAGEHLSALRERLQMKTVATTVAQIPGEQATPTIVTFSHHKDLQRK